MGILNPVKMQKGTVGANSGAPSTSPSCILFTNISALPGATALGAVYKFTSLKQAEDLGITAAYDVASDVVVHRHILDFYSMAGEGTSLRIMFCDAVPATVLEDAASIYAKRLINLAEGELRRVGIAVHMPANGGVAETVLDGMNQLVRNAIPKAQILADWAFENNMPVHVFIEARRLSDTLSATLNLREIEVGDSILEAGGVSLVAGQDWDYAEARKTASANTKAVYYGDVGKVVGTSAAAEMNQSIAEVAVFNLSDAKRGYYSKVGLSNHKAIAEVAGDLEELDTKGYIFPISLNTEAVSGYRYNNDHVCLPIVIDADGNINPHMIYYGNVLNEVSRSLRDILLQSLKKRLKADSTTGKLTTGVIKSLEGEGNQVFESFEKFGFISDGITIIDADSDLVTPPKSLLVDFEIVPTVILDNIQGTVRLKKSLTV